MKTILLLPLLFFPINDVIVEDINSSFFFIEESQIEKHNKETENCVKNYIDSLNYLDLWHLQDEPTRINLYSREICFLIRNKQYEQLTKLGLEFYPEQYLDFMIVVKLGMGRKIVSIGENYYTVDKIIQLWHNKTREQ